MFRYLTLGLICLLSQPLWAANLLTEVATKRLGTDFFVEMTFENDVSDKDVSLNYINKTIEVSVTNSTSKQKKFFTKVSDNAIEKLFTAQKDANNIYSRIILNKAATDYKATTSILSRANKLYIKVGDPTAMVSTAGVGANEIPGALIDELMAKESTNPTPKVTKTQDLGEATPVFKSDGAKKVEAPSATNIWLRLVVSLLVILGFCGGGYLALKRWPSAAKINKKAKMIEVLAQHHLGAKKSVAVLRVAGEAVLVGITDHNINILKSLSLLDEDVPKMEDKKKFNAALNNALESEEDFTMGGIKEIIGERLKNMRTF